MDPSYPCGQKSLGYLILGRLILFRLRPYTLFLGPHSFRPVFWGKNLFLLAVLVTGRISSCLSSRTIDLLWWRSRKLVFQLNNYDVLLRGPVGHLRRYIDKLVCFHSDINMDDRMEDKWRMDNKFDR